MPAPSLLAPFIGPLEQLGLPYCITGSVAASVYGEPRLTADIDVVLLLARADIEALISAFPEDENDVPPLETLMQELGREAHGMFNLIHHRTQFKADIFLASVDPLHAWAIENRRRIDLGGDGAWIAPPEYVIVRKLEYLREAGQDKHIRDVRFMLAATRVDLPFIENQVSRLQLQAQWLQCQPRL